MRRQLPRRIAPLVAVLVCVALAGCTSNEPPQGQSSGTGTADVPGATSTSGTASTDTPSSGTSTSTASPSIPPEASENSIGGAEKFVNYFISQVNTGLNSADSSKLAGLYEDSCKTCAYWANQMDSLHKAGHHVAGEAYSARSVTTSTFTAPNAGVLVTGEQLGTNIVDENGAVVDKIPKVAKADFFITAIFNSGWKVLLWQNEKS